jgi:hypothetical protein
MQHARDVQETIDDPELKQAFATERDLMDVRLVSHLMNRSKQFKTYNDIVKAFLEGLNKHGMLVKVPPAWVPAMPSGTGAASAPAAQKMLPDHAGGHPSWETVKAALDKGRCQENSTTMNIGPALEYTVVSAAEDIITLVGTKPLKKSAYGDSWNLTVKTNDIFVLFSAFKLGNAKDPNADK